MKKTDSLSQNEPIDNREDMPSSNDETASSEHPQNPLIPPAHGSSQWEGWWRHFGEGKVNGDSSSQVFSVAGDLSTFSARLTASLVPVLLGDVNRGQYLASVLVEGGLGLPYQFLVIASLAIDGQEVDLADIHTQSGQEYVRDHAPRDDLIGTARP